MNTDDLFSGKFAPPLAQAGTSGAEVGLQFGCTNDTGIGVSERGPAALDTFSHRKTTYLNFSGEHRFVLGVTLFRTASQRVSENNHLATD